MKCIILQGLPGSGKSSFVSEYTKSGLIQHVEVCSSDKYHTVDGVYDWKAENAAWAHEECFRKFERVTKKHRVSDSYNFVQPTDVVFIDNTNIRLWELYAYIRLASIRGYEVEVHTFECTVDLATERNVHGVPREVIQLMSEEMQPPLPYWPCTHVIHVEK